MKNSIVWHAEQRNVSDLRPWSKNARKISTKSFAKLKERITERGFHDVIKIDTDNIILSGNMRKKALTELKVTEVIALVPNRPLTEDEKNKIALESNISDGEWDFSKLQSFELGTLAEIGLSDDVLDKIWDRHLSAEDDGFDVGKELAKIKKPATKPGDLIILGPHKLICGDSTDPAVLKRLFGDEKAAMIYSDPVYNISIDYNAGIGGKRHYGGAVNDTRTDAEYEELIRKSLECALSVTASDAHVFYWSDQTYIWLIQTLYRQLGIQNKRVCIWLKNGQNPVPGVAFNKCYEPCTYGVIGKPYIAKNIQNLNEVLNKETTTGNNLHQETLDHLDIWTVKRLPGKDMEHATSKPPKLHDKAIRRCTKPGQIILDSFSGSGSTMIAAEQLKRRVYAVELEPAFCDLAMRRYEKLTGTKAKIIRNGHEEK